MDDNISVADLNTLFYNTVVLYNNRPTKVLRISENKVFRLLDLEAQKISVVPMAHRAITSPTRRLGMVNIDCTVMFIKRIPYRKYQIGINAGNVAIKYLALEVPHPARDVETKLHSMEHASIADCMFGRYPDLETAYNSAVEFAGVFAFDRQFAVDYAGNIYYKLKCVGRIPGNKPVVKEIIWDPRFKYLILLLEGNYEKSIRDFGPTFAC